MNTRALITLVNIHLISREDISVEALQHMKFTGITGHSVRTYGISEVPVGLPPN